MAEAFARDYPKHVVAARLVAFAVSAIQVPRGAHYAGDVAVGMLIGLAAERTGNAAGQAVFYRTDDDQTRSGAYRLAKRDVLL